MGQFSLGNETFEAEQSLPTNSANQSAPLKKGFTAAATCFTSLFNVSAYTKIAGCSGAEICLWLASSLTDPRTGIRCL